MGQLDVKAHLRERITSAAWLYQKDLGAMEEAHLTQSIGGAARTAVDFTYEVAFVNRRIAARLSGDTPPEEASEGWMTAPLDKRSKEACVADLRASVEALLAAWDALPEDRLEEKIVTPNGESTPISMASLAATHMMYHDAQLNYIQAFHGDEAVHWD